MKHAAGSLETPFLLGMMRLHEVTDLHPPTRLAAWIETRLDEGLEWFDHADIYGDTQGEALFGAALRTRPGLAARVRVVTKASIVTPAHDASPFRVKHYDSSPEYLAQSIEASLARLGVERLDHFLLHRPSPLMDAEATGRALDDAIDAGKVGAVGVSNFLPDQWRRLQAAMHHRLTAHQLQLSLDHHQPLFDGSYDALIGDGLIPLVWSPLGGGRVFQGPAERLLIRLAEERGMTPAGLALAWLRALPGRPRPVIGSLREERIAALQADAECKLDSPTWYALLEAARGHEVA